MATKAKDNSENERIKEVIRLLKLAIRDCEQLLDDTNEAVKESGQDNDPISAGG